MTFAKKKIVSADGEPIPWMNHATLMILKKRLNSELALFEYGSGYSTAFFAALVDHVVSIEYDEVWYEKMKNALPKNVKIRRVKEDIDGQYSRAILDEAGMFDVVIVDGRDRINCVKYAVEKLTDRGIIVLDDSDRERYKQAFSFMKDRGFRALSIEGLKNGFFTLDETTIFYRDGNCIRL